MNDMSKNGILVFIALCTVAAAAMLPTRPQYVPPIVSAEEMRLRADVERLERRVDRLELQQIDIDSRGWSRTETVNRRVDRLYRSSVEQSQRLHDLEMFQEYLLERSRPRIRTEGRE